ncbi:MAG TPA: TrkA C-terminal domain-containing protein [Verrucomicrobiota bacterium]|nr:TrkA C-terminal domain-containing protein [Verrucomicrobiota bacterium]HNU51992.1 TrkA C-terminal domain-containing protein [Verrucomicrobiota bacterium]
MREFTMVLERYPEVPLFLSLAVGYVVGKLRFRGFGIGTTASVLLAGMAFGQLGLPVPPILKSVGFALFAFCIGYQVGPQFFGSLRKEGMNYLAISLVVAVVGLGTALALGKVFGFDRGTTAGLFAGAMTQSAAIGTAEGAVDSLAISSAAKRLLVDHIAASYAITYLFGVVGVVVFFKFLPRLLRVDLKAEAAQLEERMGGQRAESKRPELFAWSAQVGLRAFAATGADVIGKTVGELEFALRFPARGAVYHIRRGAALLPATPETVVQAGDILVVGGKHAGLVRAAELIGREVDISGVTSMLGEAVAVHVLNPAVIGRTLGDLGRLPGARGIFLSRMTRQGHPLPLLEETVIAKCDVMHVVGAQEDVERAVKALGYAERASAVTDLVMVAVGCLVGTLLGMIVIPVGGIPVTLGTGGGVLLAGLICGWLRSVRPMFGRIPDAGQWLLNELGLSLFVACIGLTSGKAAIAALQTAGMSIFAAGVILALAPVVAGALIGRYVLKMNPILLLGALSGARVIPQAMLAMQEDAESATPALGFAAPYAFANVLLTVMGSIIINLM